MSNKTTEEIAGKFLGKKVAGKDTYSPEFLVAVPRQEHRTYLGLDENNYPEGFDTWYAYEFTGITNKGVPFNRVCKIVYPSSNFAIVESKSLKLYLNSFAMTKLGDTVEECLEEARKTIASDLSGLLKTDVQVSFLTSNSCRKGIFGEYVNLNDKVDIDSIDISEYNENKDLLQISDTKFSEKTSHSFVFNSLRSACRITF